MKRGLHIILLVCSFSIASYTQAQERMSPETLEKLITLIRAIDAQHNVQIDKNDIILLTDIKIFCTQIHEQTGVPLTPTELINSMYAACADIQTWKIFCNEHGIPYTTPMELFEQLISIQSEKTAQENKYSLIFSAGTITGAIGGVMYANPIKNTLKSEGALILAQAGKQHALFTKKLPLTPEQKLGMDISFDTLIAICTYHAGAHTSRNQGIIDAITQPQADSDINIALQYSTSQDRNGALPTLATTCEYTPTYKDYALLTADSIASNLINHAPLAEHNEVYISCNNEAYTLLSKNLLLRAGKESSKDMIHQVTAAYLSSNKDNLDYNPSRLAKKTVGIIAEHTAKEVSYGLVAQLIHNKIVPSATTKTATLLKTFFPADGVPKDNTQEITRLVTIGTITFCAATGLTLAKNAGSWTLENVISPYLGRMSQ